MATKRNATWTENWIVYGIDAPRKTWFLNGPVNYDLVEAAIAAFHLFEQDEKPVTIYMNCPGGDEVCGMAIYDLIKNSKCHVTVRVVGEACSMGAIILQAADVREAMPHAVIMHHAGDGNEMGGHKENVRRYYKFADKYDEFLNKVMLDRVNEKRAKDGLEPKEPSWWKKEDTWDRWLLPEQAIELGLLDKIYNGV